MSGAQAVALVVANGDCDARALEAHYRDIEISAPLVIAVDGGLAHLQRAGIAVDFFVGDADSIDKRRLDALDLPVTRCWSLPRDKDASDLEHALERVTTLGVSEVDLFGVSGGRTDHMLLNWQLPMCRRWPFRLSLHDMTTVGVTVRPEQPLTRRVAVGTTFSVLALSAVTGLCIAGACWPLDDCRIEPGQTLGLSNRAVDTTVDVSVVSGVALVLFVRDFD